MSSYYSCIYRAYVCVRILLLHTPHTATTQVIRAIPAEFACAYFRRADSLPFPAVKTRRASVRGAPLAAVECFLAYPEPQWRPHAVEGGGRISSTGLLLLPRVGLACSMRLALKGALRPHTLVAQAGV